MEIEIEALAAEQLFALQGGDPRGAKPLIHLGSNAVPVLGSLAG
jgi:hypothetical protein